MNPFTDNSAHSVSALGEQKLIAAIHTWLGASTPPSPQGIGDDCAVWKAPPKTSLITTTDALVWQKHFDASIDGRQAGKKLLKRNLSDIAAMGGMPLNAVVALQLPQNLKLDWLEAFYRGIAELSQQYSVSIIGGDISECPVSYFAATLTLNGSAQSPLLRSEARPGDSLWVTGTLGGSIAQKHWDFTPRLAEGQWLAEQPEVHTLMDLTDGIAKDLPELIPTNCSAFLDTAQIPLSPDIELAPKHSPLQHALCDGEDYELLFSLSSKITEQAFRARWKAQFKTPLACIGQLRKTEAEANHGQILDANTARRLTFENGFEHLSNHS